MKGDENMQNLCLLLRMMLCGWMSVDVNSKPPGKTNESVSHPGRTVIKTTCVDDNATGYGTFQSHNQKVVNNRNGIFMTHVRTRNKAYTAQQWRLSRSTDGGKRFATIYEATHATNPPVLETDEEGNIYLARPDFLDGNAYLYRFLAENQYANPLISPIENGAAGKYCMIYDAQRKQLYYFAHNNTFHVIGLNGIVRQSQHLLRAGPSAVLQYPLLSLDSDGTLHAAWTTQAHGRYLYWDIHHMLSRDGGQTWKRMDGTLIHLPVLADQHGPTDRITLDDEYEVHTWLSNFTVKDGKLHFVYLAQTQSGREHYVRYDLKTAQREQDIWPEFKGQQLSLRSLDGFFASHASLSGAPLYCISTDKGRIACLASDNSGETWYDYAVSDQIFAPYAIGGCRDLTPEGYIIGSFTHRMGSSQDSDVTFQVHFFKIQTGLGLA